MLSQTVSFSDLLFAARKHLGTGLCPDGLAAAIAAQQGSDIETVFRELGASQRVAVDSDPAIKDARPLLRALTVASCRRMHCVPVLVKQGEVAVLMDDPWAVDDIRQIAQAFGSTPHLVWSSRKRIASLIDELASARPSQVDGNAGRGDGDGIDRSDVDGSSSSAMGRASPEHEGARVISIETLQSTTSEIVRFVDQHVLDAWHSSASDIHFEMCVSGVHVKYRLDGVLIDAARQDSNGLSGDAIINRIKVLARLDISETRIPQDGRFRATVGGRAVDFRVSIMPSIFGEDAVVRLLDKAQLRSGDDRIDLGRLGFDTESLKRLRRAAAEPHGMVLVTGPTGSGKTTTLYALLSELHRGDEKFVTIEDPVEYQLPGVLQIPVNEKKGLTFARGLRSILRHDPDKILVGEIRDSETAEIAVQAALTGHLVFTTVHANNVYDVVGRFLHMNVDLYGFASALNCMVAQRLLRTNCSHCSAPVEDANATEALEVAGFLERPFDLRRGSGCARCRGTGYAGRRAIGEVLPVDDRFRELVVQRAPGRVLREHVAALNVTPLRHTALRLLATGQTTLEEVSRVVGSTN